MTPAGDLVVRRIGRLLPMTAPPLAAAALVIRAGRVAWVGRDADLPTGWPDVPELDAAGAAVTPGFVDCHTHLVWAGNRRQEFVARLAGAPYTGGGIHTTVAATRAANTDQLIGLAAGRAAAALAGGTTTLEVKTGYGLSRVEELRLLEVIRRLAAAVPQRVEVTYLGAHTVPAETDRSAYVDEVVATLPAARTAGARWCDVFCDRGGFDVPETRRVLTAARAAGLGLRLHADQLARIGATSLAAELRCASADHLDRIDAAGAAELAAAGTVAVLLPTATLTMRTGEWGQYAVLGAAGATVALATDCNPGTSWCESMPYVVQLACLGLGMPVEVAFRAATLGAARALRRTDIGRLTVGGYGDAVVLAAAHEADVVAHLGAPTIERVVIGGAVYAPGSLQSSKASSASTST